MDEAVQEYIDGIAAEHRPLFDRLHGLIMQVHPEATVRISYDMPTYVVGGRKLFVAAWRHGISMYGWSSGQDAGFAARHPTLLSGRRTMRLRPQDAAQIPDEELRDFLRAALQEGTTSA